MERVFVVIDKPANAWNCPFAEDDGFCVVLKGTCSACISEDPKHLFPDNCPLRPLPEKDMNYGEDDYCTGWNDCLDEMLGEENAENNK